MVFGFLWYLKVVLLSFWALKSLNFQWGLYIVDWKFKLLCGKGVLTPFQWVCQPKKALLSFRGGRETISIWRKRKTKQYFPCRFMRRSLRGVAENYMYRIRSHWLNSSLRNLLSRTIEPILYRLPYGLGLPSPECPGSGTEIQQGSLWGLGGLGGRVWKKKKEALILQWKIYHFVDHFRAYKLEI